MLYSDGSKSRENALYDAGQTHPCYFLTDKIVGCLSCQANKLLRMMLLRFSVERLGGAARSRRPRAGPPWRSAVDGESFLRHRAGKHGASDSASETIAALKAAEKCAC